MVLWPGVIVMAVIGRTARVICMPADALLPALSLAWMITSFMPGKRVTGHRTVFLTTRAGWPLHVTLAIPDKSSVTLPVTVISALRVVIPLTGLVTLTLGGVTSTPLDVCAAGAMPPGSNTMPATANKTLRAMTSSNVLKSGA
jgi:hypothetical protein